MKKTLLKIGGVIMTLAFAFIAVQCADKNEKENAGKKVAVAEKKEAVLPNYRYVDGDSVLAAYILAKDYNEEMLRMQTNFDNTARQRENAIQAEMNKMQQKMQNNGYLTEESYKSDEQKLVKMQSSAQNELAKMQTNMQNAAMEAQKIVNDSITSYINEYNKKYGYDAIFFKAATLYIDDRLDITDDVIKGLNARYNKEKK
jgi:outer membrane protein